MDIKRKPFQGVLNILDFNRHFYYFGIAALIILIALANTMNIPSIIRNIVIIGFAYGLLMPLIVSAYVYDYSGYYTLDWINDYIDNKMLKNNIVNINAGFDETSFIIESHLPNSKLHVYDFYEQDLHTEPAIVRARKVSMVYPNTTEIKSNCIPQKENSVDFVFLLSAAHEIRDKHERVEFLKECHRICKPDGQVIMVEHLRDIPNLFAFTIGVNHFHSKAVWKDAFHQAGFSTILEKKFTPFMSIFQCQL